MILEFKTKRNANGHRRYLAIDTEAKTYARQCPRMTTDGVEVTATVINDLIDKCKASTYTETDYIY